MANFQSVSTIQLRVESRSAFIAFVFKERQGKIKEDQTKEKNREQQ